LLKLKDLHVQYITNDAGVKSAVILPIEQFQELLEDLAVVAERPEEPTLSHEDLLAQLKQDSFLSD
jgi:hypothetical protein